MDAPQKTRVLNRSRSAQPSQSQRGEKQVVIPMTREQADEHWRDPAKMRKFIDGVMAESPELFPACLREGYGLHGFARASKKLAGFQLRKICPSGGSEAYHLRPSFVMSYMTGTTDDLKYPLLLASFGVPCWVLTQGFGHSDMYWQRLLERLGRNSLVGTTVSDPQRLPEHLAADEHHVDWNGEKGYVATTAAEGCLLGIGLTKAADDEHLTAAYGDFAAEARDVNPEYAPKTVNTDGWAATQNAFKACFPTIVVMLCFLPSEKAPIVFAARNDLAVESHSDTLLRNFALPREDSIMLRKQLLMFGVYFALAAPLWGQAPAKRVNIVFMFADDWGRYASAYAKVDGRPSANDVVRTPNIDRVAREGVLFRNAFVNAPSCTPCRSSLLSGRYFFRTGRGAILHNAVWDSAIPSWPLLLRNAGYFIGKSFKVWSPGTPVDAPFDGQKHAYEKAGREFVNFSENATKMVQNGMTFDAARAKLLGEVRGNFQSFLSARPKGQPFCYWFGPTLVHRTWQKGSGQALWGIDPDALKGKLPKFLPDVPEVRSDFADYLGEIQAWDAGVGVILQMLEEAGELENTLIVISGDHGAPGFPGGKCNLYDFGTHVPLIARGPGIRPNRQVEDFAILMDLAPTFLEVGHAKQPEGMQGRSLTKTLYAEKSGLVDPERTFVVTGRERHVAFARAGNVPYPSRALRTAEFLYIRNFAPDRWPMGDPTNITDTEAPSAADLANYTYAAFADMDASPTRAWVVEHRNDPKWKWHYNYAFGKRPGEQLFDLSKDADQITNVADQAEYAAAKKELAARLLRILNEAGDPRVIGDGLTFERSPFTDENPKKTPKQK